MILHAIFSENFWKWNARKEMRKNNSEIVGDIWRKGVNYDMTEVCSDFNRNKMMREHPVWQKMCKKKKKKKKGVVPEKSFSRSSDTETRS